MALTMDKRIQKDSILFPKRLKLFTAIYIGHTPTLYYNKTTPMHACNVWNMDTGAAFTGKLSIMDVDSQALWQSDPVCGLYPGEAGRNKD
jgi:serine/threonine protein phosphatase 1